MKNYENYSYSNFIDDKFIMHLIYYPNVMPPR